MNPLLPLQEYVPDGEPHVFEERIYLFGSHDMANGTKYCAAGDYVAWSAPINDLTDWRYDGRIYSSEEDPQYDKETGGELYAPDVVRGNDGRYYLYYNLVTGTSSGFHSEIHVAVADKPAGKYQYLGVVRNPDGSIYNTYLVSDPAVINDDGVIRVYAGWSLSLVARTAHRSGGKKGVGREGVHTGRMPAYAQDGKERSGGQDAQGRGDAEQLPPYMVPKEQLYPVYQMMFDKTKEEVDALAHPLMGANTFTLADDMLTVNSEMRRIVEGQFATPPESGFYGHAFYEASSIRKVNGKYYFIYSSENSNELCYAVSEFPDKDFVYGGTIISNGDVGFEGRKNEERLNMTGNNHGSIECVGGEWYVFYHRQTNRSTFSRQACAERITIDEEGRIAQVECTSEGIGVGHLQAKGTYPAAICCNLTNGHMPHCTNTMIEDDIPYVTQRGEEVYVANVKDGTKIAYKYFDFKGTVSLQLVTRGNGRGKFVVKLLGQNMAEISVEPDEKWNTYAVMFSMEMMADLTFEYQGSGARDLLEMRFA